MTNKICANCGKEIGRFAKKAECADGFICAECWEKIGFSLKASVNNPDLRIAMFNIKQMTIPEIEAVHKKYHKNLEIIQNFKPTDNFGKIAQFDDENKQFILSSVVRMSYKPENYSLFQYNQIIGFEILEDGETVADGGLGRAAVGGALFGGAGAIVGAATRKSKNICTNLEIKITVKNYLKPAFYIKLITNKQKKSGFVYKQWIKVAQDIVSKLQLIVNSLNENMDNPYNPYCQKNVLTADPADEIRKYKALLDDGIITQEEFNAKKKQLLNL